MARKNTPAPEIASGATRLRITAKRPGFRRAGRTWTTTPQTVFAGDFTGEQLAALRAEPILTVETLDA